MIFRFVFQLYKKHSGHRDGAVPSQVFIASILILFWSQRCTESTRSPALSHQALTERPPQDTT